MQFFEAPVPPVLMRENQMKKVFGEWKGKAAAWHEQTNIRGPSKTSSSAFMSEFQILPFPTVFIASDLLKRVYVTPSGVE